MMLPILFLILIAIGIGFRFLPWEVKLGIVGVVVLAVLILREKLLIWLFMIPFRWKSRTLRRATIQVHGLTPTAKPPQAEPEPIPYDDENPPSEPPPPEPERRYFVLDVTISPAPRNSSPFVLWEVGELQLVAPGEDVMRGDGPNDSCVVYSNTVERPAHIPPPERTPDGEEIDDDYGYKVGGPHRVRFVIGVKHGVTKLGFQYYFEKFGEVTIPVPTA